MITKTRTKNSDLREFLDIKKVSRNTKEIKQKLFRMALNNKSRPSQKTKEGRALSSYTNFSSKAFDEEFNQKIRNARPDWFLSQKQIVIQKKQKLIQMAKSGQKRPSHDKTNLGRDLSNYTRTSSFVYDSEFHIFLKDIRPDWFK